MTYAFFTSLAVCVLGAALVVGPGCTDATSPLDGASDSGTPQPGADATTAAGDSGAADAASCAPADVSGLQPVWHRPAPFHQGACNDTELGLFAACVAKGTVAACSGVLPGCAACLATSDSAERWGPLIVHKGWAEVNIAGCLSNAMNDPTGVLCAAALQAANTCEMKACAANCPVSDTGSYASYNACRTLADHGACSGFAHDAECVQDLGDAGEAAGHCVGGNFIDIATLFCSGVDGGGGADAGTDAGPAPSDAGEESG